MPSAVLGSAGIVELVGSTDVNWPIMVADHLSLEVGALLSRCRPLVATSARRDDQLRLVGALAAGHADSRRARPGQSEVHVATAGHSARDIQLHVRTGAE